MNVTESRFKNRQLHIEDYLQMVSAEQREYAEVFAYTKITEKSGVITDYWTNNLLELILRKDNLNQAYKQVRKNKGKGGIDGMQVDELLPFLRENQQSLIQEIREGKYKPNPVRRVEIPKETKGEFRKLGVPTVVDRVIQQAIAQELSPIYEEQFLENSFGFRPKRGAHDALRQCQRNVNDGYVYVVDITEAGEALREQAVSIPYRMTECVKLDREDAAELYRILHKMLGSFEQETLHV